MLDITERAAAVVHQSQEAASRFNPDVRIRVVRAGTGLAFAFTDAADPTDRELDCLGTLLLVEASIEGTIDIGEHNTPVLLPAP
jgi:Fe-S cluster assembly iron-binding protein IscA